MTTTTTGPRTRRGAGGAALAALALIATLLQPAGADGQPAGAFPSDDFNRTELGGDWNVVNPLRDGSVKLVGGGSGDARLEMAVPEGVNHEPWNVNRSVRVLRDAQDVDFTAVTRFQSVPTERYQMQGILVQQDADNWLRFEVHHNGTDLRAFAGVTVDRSSTRRMDEPAVAAAVSYLQVSRTGNTWALATSADGTNWVEAGRFDHEMEVDQIGLFVGSGGASPAYTAVADYLFDAGAPIDPEDGGSAGGDYTLDVTATGPGAVGRSPDKATYAAGEQVTLTPVAGRGAAFGGWTGDASGGDSPLVVTMDRSLSIGGTFAPDASPPAILGLTVYPGASSALVAWSTDEVATASVEAGPTDALEYGSYASTTPATDHRITIPGLSPGRSYRFVVHATNVAGLTTTSPVATFITAVAPSVSFESDDFNRTTLEPKPWTAVDPVGDGTVQVRGGESTNARLELTVPGGPAHDTTDTNESLRVLQAAADIDFTAEIKFEELPSTAGQSTGLLLQQDADNWIVVDIAHDGSSLRARAATTSNGASTSRIDAVARADAKVWMRVVRDGDDWELRTSANGSSWTSVGSFSFPMAVTAVGPYASNAGAPAPAYTSVIDYVFEGSAPIVPEDQPDAAVLREMEVEVDGDGTIERTPDQDAYVAGTEVRLTAVPDGDAAFTGWGGDLTGAENPVDVVLEDDMSVSASFAQDAQAPLIDGVTVVPSASSAVVSWRTDEPTTASVSVGTSAAFENGAFGSAYRTREHSVTVTGLNPGATYTFAPSSTDAAGHTTTAPNATFATSGGGAPVIDVWNGFHQVFGGHGRAQSWANVSGSASDPEGVTSMSYSLNGGEERPLTVGPNQRRLQSPGDFNADVPFDELNVGDNQVRLTATDATGASASATVAVERVEGDPSLPYETDWAAAGRLQDQAQPVDGRWTIDGDTVRTMAFGYDRVLALGDTSWHDYEVEFPVTINAIGPDAGSHLSGQALVGFGMNWQGHTVVASEQPGYFWYPTGALGWYRWYSPAPKFELRGNMDQPVSRTDRFQLTFGTTYRFKGRSETVDGGVEYSWKIWADGAPEPSGWMLKVTEDDGPATGSVILIAHHADAQFGNVSVRPLDP